jgi:hypothetical protein
VPGAFDVIGIADAAATVSVNSDPSGVYRRGQYFRKELPVNNGSDPVWQAVAVTSCRRSQPLTKIGELGLRAISTLAMFAS